MTGVQLRVCVRGASPTRGEILRAADTVEAASAEIDEAALGDIDEAWWQRASVGLSAALRSHASAAPEAHTAGHYRAASAPADTAPAPMLGAQHVVPFLTIRRDTERIVRDADAMPEGVRAARRRMLACVSAAAIGIGILRVEDDDPSEDAA